MKASSLMQTSKYSPEVGFQYDDITKTISNPAGGTPYHYTPNNIADDYIFDFRVWTVLSFVY